MRTRKKIAKRQRAAAVKKAAVPFKPMFKVDSWYMIQFLDHAIGKGSVLTEVCARSYEGCEKEDTVVFTYWHVVGEDEETTKDNMEPLSIVKSTIKRKKRIPSFAEDDAKRRTKLLR